ncbi:MAG TPA: glycosyltransferase [Terriglobales bacterium]|nr:glycosyltransferase [Terriglobales bacterium]
MPTEGRASSTHVLALLEAHTVTGPAKNLLQLWQMSQRLEHPLQISVAVFQRERTAGESGNTFIVAARERGMNVHLVPEASAFDPRVLGRLRDLAGRLCPDILQTHAVKSHFLLRLSRLWKAHPWVAFHHGYTTTDPKMLAYNQLDRWSLRAPRQIVTVSEASKRQLCRRGVDPARVAVIHNAVEVEWLKSTDPSAVSQLVQQHAIEAGDSVILAVGRFSREKALIDLVPAARELARCQPNLRFRVLLVGDGPERPRVQQSVQAAGLQGRFIFAGQVQDVRPYYRLATVLAIPSHSEGSPNALLEAMAAGVPVVATSVGGIPEIVEDNNTALLVPARAPAALASALAHLLSNPEAARQQADRARQLVASQYTPQARAQFLAELYDRVRRQPHP